MAQQQPKPKGHWPDLHQPPASFPSAEIKAVIDRVRGAETDNVKAAYAATVVIGYGITQLPHDHPIIGAVATSHEEGVAMLEDALKQNESGAPKTVGVLPWARILAFVLPYLLDWLEWKS